MENEKSERGRKNRKAGKRFENKVQEYLESQGWIVMRFTKKIENGKLVNCKPKFNPFTRTIQSFQTGFPDFLCLRLRPAEIKLVECKMNGYLNPGEREMVKSLNELGFDKIEVASKDEKEIKFETH